MRDKLVPGKSEAIKFRFNIAKIALVGFGIYRLGISAITLNDLMGILFRKDPEIARSLKDAIDRNPAHLGAILTALKPADIDHKTVSSVVSQVSCAVRRGKGRPHNLLINLLCRASLENLIDLDE